MSRVTSTVHGTLTDTTISNIAHHPLLTTPNPRIPSPPSILLFIPNPTHYGNYTPPSPSPRLNAAPLILPHPTTGPTLSRSLSPRPSNCRWRLNGLYPHGLSPFRRSGHGRWRTCMSSLPSVPLPYSSPPRQEFSSPRHPLSSQLFDGNTMEYIVRSWWLSPPPPSTLWRGNCIGRQSCVGWK